MRALASRSLGAAQVQDWDRRCYGTGMNQGVGGATQSSGPGMGGGGVTGPMAPLLRPSALAGRGEVVGAGMDTAASGWVTGKLVVLHTNYISNQPERGAGINLPGGQLCESSWN